MAEDRVQVGLGRADDADVDVETDASDVKADDAITDDQGNASSPGQNKYILKFYSMKQILNYFITSRINLY